MKTIVQLTILFLLLTTYILNGYSEENLLPTTITKKCIDTDHLQVCINNMCTTAPCTAERKCTENIKLLNGSQCLEMHSPMLSANSQRINEWKPFTSEVN